MMHIVRLWGGLGNQLFQYAFAKAYSIKNHCDMLLDISFYKNKKINNDAIGGSQHIYYGLKLYKTDAKLATEEDCAKLRSMPSKKYTSARTLKSIFKKESQSSENNIIRETDPGVYEPSLLDYRDNVYCHGCLQSEKYFIQYRNELLKYLSLDVPLDEQNTKILSQIKLTNSVSLHIRRGDYERINWVLPISYYKDSIEYIKSKEKDLHFYIFSNDVQWVHENLILDDAYTVVDINPPNKGYYDLELMRNCKHNIIANSTFSWWGAWLNQNPERIVVAPDPWTTDPRFYLHIDRFRDTIPESWIKIDWH